MVNSTILYTWKLLRVDLKHSHHQKKKKLTIWGDVCVNWSWYHSTMCIKSLHLYLNIYIIFVNYPSVKFKTWIRTVKHHQIKYLAEPKGYWELIMLKVLKRNIKWACWYLGTWRKEKPAKRWAAWLKNKIKEGHVVVPCHSQISHLQFLALVSNPGSWWERIPALLWHELEFYGEVAMWKTRLGSVSGLPSTHTSLVIS